MRFYQGLLIIYLLMYKGAGAENKAKTMENIFEQTIKIFLIQWFEFSKIMSHPYTVRDIILIIII